MLRGDLASLPLDQVLLRLGDGASGCLHVSGPAGETGVVHVRDGLVHAASLPQVPDQLGPRLVAAGLLSIEQLADAERARATELTEWLLSELLVHLGHVDEEHVAAVVRERALDAACQIAGWTAGAWRFRRGERARRLLPEPLSVAGLLALVADRRGEQRTLLAELGGSGAVPAFADEEAATSPDLSLGHDGLALLTGIDGGRTVAELGARCGMTLLEVLRLMHGLRTNGLIVVTPSEAETVPEAANWAALDLHDLVHDSSVTLDSTLDSTLSTSLGVLAGAEDVSAGDGPVGASLTRVSQALNTLMGPVGATGGEDADPATGQDPTQLPTRPAPGLPEALSPELQRRERIRAAAAAELALAHADAEAQRTRTAGGPSAVERAVERAVEQADERADELQLAREALGMPLTLRPGTQRPETLRTSDAEPQAWQASAGQPPAPGDARSASEATDTAALLRELSNLGNDQDAAPRPPSPRPAPVTPEASGRGWRKGRFGR